MDFEWDENKRRCNLEKHRVDFVDATELLSQSPLVLEDSRHDYGEPRYVAMGYLNDKMLVIVFTVRDDVYRIISARRGNVRERGQYEILKKSDHDQNEH